MSHAHRPHEPFSRNEMARSRGGTVAEIAESCAHWLWRLVGPLSGGRWQNARSNRACFAKILGERNVLLGRPKSRAQAFELFGFLFWKCPRNALHAASVRFKM